MRRVPTPVVAWALLLSALAGSAVPAWAGELYLVVEKTAAPGEAVPLTVRSSGAALVTVVAWRIEDPAVLLDGGVDLAHGDGLGWLDPTQGAGTPGQQALCAAARLSPVAATAAVTTQPEALHALDLRLAEPGFYLLAARAPSAAPGTRTSDTAYATALVSDLGLLVKRAAGRLLVWAVDRTTGAPRPDVEVSVRLADGTRATARTDADGFAAFLRGVPDTTDVRATAGASLAFGASRWHDAASSDRRVYVTTHQPAYRPGERVEVKGIVRGLDAGRLRIDPAVTQATVRLVAPGEVEMGKTTALLSADLGTFACSFDLVADAPTGDWAIVAEVGGRSYEAPLVVDAYRKPAFEVRVQGATPRVLAGSPTTFDVSAAFYEGGAPAGAAVAWRLLYARVDRDPFPEDELVALFFGTEREAYRPETLATGTGVLDDQGRLVVETTAPQDRPDGYLTLEATVTGPDRVAVAGSGRVGIATSPVLVALRSDRHLYGPEDVARVTVKVETADAAPAAARPGVLSVGLAPEGAEAAAGGTAHGRDLPFTTDERGEADLSVPLGNAGRYALTAVVPRISSEPAGPDASATVHVWAAGERATPGQGGGTLEVVADRDAYAVGDQARLLVLPVGGMRPVIATLERDGVLEHRVLRPDEVAPLWTIAITEDMVPNVFATFTTVDHGRALTTTKVLRIPPRTRLLTTAVEPDAAELEPGAISGLTVVVTDAAGAPVADAEVGVAVVDDALFALHQDPTAPIEAFFHPPTRNAVGSEALLDWTSVGWSPLVERELQRLADSEGLPATRAGPAPASPPPAQPAAPGRDPGDGGGAPEAAPAAADAPEESSRGEAGEERGAGFLAAEEKKRKEEGTETLRVREDFRSAVFWTPALRTDGGGRARVEEIRYGDSLTRWRVTATSVDGATRVGTGEASVRTRRNVSARLTLPRFLRAGDSVVLPLVLRNLATEATEGSWDLSVPGTDPTWHHAGTVALEPGATRVEEATFASDVPGTIPFTARLESAVGRDAERRELPVLPRGILKVEGDNLFAERGEHTRPLTVPAHAQAGSVTARVTIEPAYAQAMLAALAYLLEYPYGCTEQTMSRFVPLLAATEALKALGGEVPGLAGELPAMIDAGLARLAALRHADGGFGWWADDASDPAMTALVVRGLSRLLTVQPGNGLAQEIRDGAANALAARAAALDLDPTTRAAVAHALATAGRAPDGAFLPAGDGRWRSLPPLAQALLLRAAVALGRQDLVTALRGLLDDEARREAGLLSWSSPGGGEGEGPTRWQDDDVETTATVLLALLEAGVRPEVLDGGARWLLRAREGGDRWRSTRDTGVAVELLAALVARTGDLGAGRAVVLRLDGQTLWEGALTRETALGGRAFVELPAPALEPGALHSLTLECPEGTASASIALRYFETGPAIAASAHGFVVRRRFYRLEAHEEGRAVTWTRTPVTETLPAGALVECEVEVTTERPREYVMLTSPHAGGFEPSRETAMAVPGREPEREARREGYDDRTMFFVARLPAGPSTFRHLLRATHAGAFTALPAQVELMYFPEVRGTSAGEVWQVTPAGPVGLDRREEDR